MEDDPSACGRANRLPFSGRLPRGFPRRTIITEKVTQCNRKASAVSPSGGFFYFRKKGRDPIDTTYTIQLPEVQYTALLERAAELEIPLEDLLLQALQNQIKEEEPPCLR